MASGSVRDIAGFRIVPGFRGRRSQAEMVEAVRERPELIERWTTLHTSPRVLPAKAISSQMGSFGDSEIALKQRNRAPVLIPSGRKTL
jgi:hypothetical protein